MQHDDIRHKLSEYIDGSVTPVERSEIETHLKICLSCSEALSELQKTIEHIKAIEEIEPPAWMSQKIMAAVRAETKEKEGFFQKYFFPLHVKLPIQAVAVLFLAVTAFYINQTLQLTPELSEAPVRELAAMKDGPLIGSEHDTLGKTDTSALRSKKVPQSPESKALDMKLEYEKPAKPTIDDRAATPIPAPSKPAEQSARITRDAVKEKRSVAPQAGARGMIGEQLAPKAAGKSLQARALQESAAPPRKRKAAFADNKAASTITYVVLVADMEIASRKIEATIEELGDTISKTEQLDAKRSYTTTMSVPHLEVLYKKMELIGTIDKGATSTDLQEDLITVTIELETISTPQ